MHGPRSVRSNVLYLLTRCEEWSSSITCEWQFDGAKIGTGKHVAADVPLRALFWVDLQVAFMCGGLG